MKSEQYCDTDLLFAANLDLFGIALKLLAYFKSCCRCHIIVTFYRIAQFAIASVLVKLSLLTPFSFSTSSSFPTSKASKATNFLFIKIIVRCVHSLQEYEFKLKTFYSAEYVVSEVTCVHSALQR
jgi:hypothetical protein